MGLLEKLKTENQPAEKSTTCDQKTAPIDLDDLFGDSETQRPATVRIDLDAADAHLDPTGWADWHCVACGRTRPWWGFLSDHPRCVTCDPPRQMSVGMQRAVLIEQAKANQTEVNK